MPTISITSSLFRFGSRSSFKSPDGLAFSVCSQTVLSRPPVGLGSVDLMGSDPIMTAIEAKTQTFLASTTVSRGSDPIKSTLILKRLFFVLRPQMIRQCVRCRHDFAGCEIRRDLTGGGFRAVAAVDQIHLTAGSEVTANGAGGGFA